MVEKKILVVEDEPSIQKALQEKLVTNGYVVVVARDGEEGLEVAFRERPDLILLDIVMPRLDGVSALRRLRQDDWGAKVPVIVLTNLNDPEHISEAVENEISHYLVKSDWTLEDVLERIEERLKK